MRYEQPSVELVWITPNAAKEIEMAARTCYKSEPSYDPTKTAEFCDRIINQYHHESVSEHAVASFRIKTCRGVSHEAVRHRLASYSQESTRYCNYAKDKFGREIALIPMLEGLTEAQLAARAALYKHMEEVYMAEIDAGISPQQARDNLPTCLKTEFVMTANFREWKHFIRLRTDKKAHPQMRKVAGMIQAILQEKCPEVFGKQS